MRNHIRFITHHDGVWGVLDRFGDYSDLVSHCSTGGHSESGYDITRTVGIVHPKTSIMRTQVKNPTNGLTLDSHWTHELKTPPELSFVECQSVVAIECKGEVE